MAKDKEGITPDVNNEALLDELAQLRRENEALKAQATDGLHRTLGNITLKIETPEGDISEVAYEIAPGTPKMNLAEGNFFSQDVVDLVNGKVDELRTDTGKVALTADSARKQLTAYAAKGVRWLSKAAVMLLVLVASFLATPTEADAQVRTGRWYTFPVDTVSNVTGSTTIDFTFPYQLSASGNFSYAVQLNATAVSGSNTFLAIVQESLFDTGDNWVTVDTLNITGAGAVLETGTAVGIRSRIRVTNSGTGVKLLNCVVRYRDDN